MHGQVRVELEFVYGTALKLEPTLGSFEVFMKIYKNTQTYIHFN